MVELYYAEDDAGIAGIVKEYLEQKDFKVTVYATFSELRQALKNHVPTLVLLDWNMPDGRGTVCAIGSGAAGRNCRSFSLPSGIPMILCRVSRAARMTMW